MNIKKKNHLKREERGVDVREGIFPKNKILDQDVPVPFLPFHL